ncbi:MAG: ribosome silencing factor [Armatimonadetes bacterium]|nr:ribosome silencing factor [Armatimonadota bacterium]
MTSEDKVRLVVEAADSKQARNMAVLDLRGLTLMTDYFLVCEGTSSVHIRTITDHIVETMKHAGLGGIRVEGYATGKWVLMDYQDVVAHVMAPEQREYYSLESFWSEAPQFPIVEGRVVDLERSAGVSPAAESNDA